MQATGVTRLKGALQDADTLGPQVRPRTYHFSTVWLGGTGRVLWIWPLPLTTDTSPPLPCISARLTGSCGCQVWARLHSGLWWPGEMLDPFHLPPTRSLPPGAAAGKRPVTAQRLSIACESQGGVWSEACGPLIAFAARSRNVVYYL